MNPGILRTMEVKWVYKGTHQCLINSIQQYNICNIHARMTLCTIQQSTKALKSSLNRL